MSILVRKKGEERNDRVILTSCCVADSLAQKMGESLAKMHSLNIVHGDLTTSNFMLREGSDSLVNIE
jgi:tRNA A-37 threonylcarbamoyl transferase component Bud32